MMAELKMNNSWKNNNTIHKSKREIWKLEERLIPATIDRLNQEMEKRPDLQRLLNTPLKDLNEKYLNLYDPEFVEYFKDETLLNIISSSLQSKECVYFYSEANNDLEGFAYYKVSRDGLKAYGITVFSFDVEHPSFVLARDMIRLLKELKAKFYEIEFQCIEDQPLVDSYKRITKELGGTYDFDDGLWFFEIKGDRYTRVHEKLNSKEEEELYQEALEYMKKYPKVYQSLAD